MGKRRRQFEEEDERISESWLIPYADILTLLLALFIVLFASSVIDNRKFMSIMEAFKSELTGTRIDDTNVGLTVNIPKNPISEKNLNQQKAKPAPALTKEDRELLDLKNRLQNFIDRNHLQANVTIQDTKRGVEITFKEVVLFDPGKADLKKSSYNTLNSFVKLIKTMSNPISIEGHTDNVPIQNPKYPSNWELSSARAVSVLHYFESHKIAKSRLQFVGYGEYKPIYKNDTPAHRKANRRVNVVILRSNQ
ncbi:OmpA family protein [Neobacillus sp. YIM B02564]|uniref:OmpA family protein n=1 Tax=Neobacillus paridis TaxID=2803862 RepID=A0ABS1TP11_9BACI|nr:OmpA family protein [Neobacillus paridis]MBL4952908.1 OmpA family protein [Neobacillus paridis]